MRRWLLVTNRINQWMQLDDDEISIEVEKPVRRGDKVLVYKTSPHNHFSHIFRVKNDAYMEAETYQMNLYDKITIKNPVTLKELKEHDYLGEWQSYFKKSFYPIPLCTWGKIIGCILQKNPDIIEPFEAEGCYGPHNEGFPLNYQDNLLKIIKGIRKYDLSTFNEEATKYKIILPLLYHLGWNIYDLKQIFPEYPVKHSTKKVDYLLTDHKNNKIFIEAKKPNIDLDSVKCQIIEYCASKNVNIGIITNGIQWRFYNIEYHDNRLGAIKKWDKDEINLLEDTSEEIIHQLVSFFWNDNTCPEGQLYENRNMKTIFTNISKIKGNEKYFYNESAVKQVIILPLLEDLGWDINNNSEFIFDLYNKGKKVDYVLGKGKNRIFIEVKALTDDPEIYDTLEKYEEQILKYGDAAVIDFGVLINGKVWKFYHLKTRDRIKVKIEKDDKIFEKFHNLLSKEKVDSGLNIKYLEKLA